jgi:hypothetical protein
MLSFGEFLNEDILYTISVEPIDPTVYNFTPEIFKQKGKSFAQAKAYLIKTNARVRGIIYRDEGKLVWKNPHGDTLLAKYFSKD